MNYLILKRLCLSLICFAYLSCPAHAQLKGYSSAFVSSGKIVFESVSKIVTETAVYESSKYIGVDLEGFREEDLVVAGLATLSYAKGKVTVTREVAFQQQPTAVTYHAEGYHFIGLEDSNLMIAEDYSTSANLVIPGSSIAEEPCGTQTNAIQIIDCNDPLLIDLGQDGIHLGKAGRGVLFDMNADGNKTPMHWVQKNGNEAFLAMDTNNNGIIDSGLELFGNAMPIIHQQIATMHELSIHMADNSKAVDFEEIMAPDGFAALAQYDRITAGGNNDGYISVEDAIWTKLTLWLDFNADGISTFEEMLNLDHTGITHLDITPKYNGRRDSAGNRIPLWSWAVDNDADSNNKYKMVDVFFKPLQNEIKQFQ